MFAKYDAYKDSGLEWLGNIPQSWEVKPLKYGAKIVLGKMLCPEDKGGYFLKPYLKSKNIQWLKVDISSVEKMWFSKKELPLYQLQKGDLILSEGGEVGKVCIWDNELEECYIQNSAHKVSVDNTSDSKYHLYQMFAFGQRKLFDSIVNRVSIAHLTREKLSSIKFIFPSLSEQKQIVKFLDQKIFEIDQAIAIKEQQIALLNERKQIVIQKAVTQGLDPNVPMKDSGVEWIGQIPEHWELKKIKHVTSKIGSGVTPSGGGATYLDEGIPLLRSQNIHFDRIDLNDVARISEKVHHSMSNSKVRKNDVLLNITGGSIGRCYFVETSEEMNVNQHVCILRPKKNITSIFLNAVLASEVGQGQIWYFQQGGGREGLNFQALKNFDIALPPIEEQILISKKVEEIYQQFGNMNAHIQMQIEKLKEYKTTLINDAVTGKIKVA